MPEWKAPQRPIDHVEASLVTAILDGHYAPGDHLPGERDLAGQLGVTRPTLREALRRLERDGWLSIQQGKATRVNDFWREGGPNILGAMARYGDHLPSTFVTQLLEVRCVLAPAYTEAAIQSDAVSVTALVAGYGELAPTAAAYARFDWDLHHGLTVLSANPVYTLILNGFASFYAVTAPRYFAHAEARRVSREYYHDLHNAAATADAARGAAVTRAVMKKSIRLWQWADLEPGPGLGATTGGM